jgi:CBS domain-containing protein
MNVKELMTKKIISVNTDTTVVDAAKKMDTAGVGTVLVLDNDKLVGIITDRDVTTRAVANNQDVYTTTCDKIMSKEVTTATVDTDVDDILDLMSDLQVKRIPITDDNNKVVGIITLKDISQSEWEEEAGDVLNNITEESLV